MVTAEDEQVNQASALWARPKSEITDEQYQEFYKHVSHDFEAPLAYSHARVEGRHEYTQLLFIPQRAPFDLWNRDSRHGIKLYIRRVFVMDDAEQLMPAYLRFVRGVIDSSDLPLNVSREILQDSADVAFIRNASVKRVLGMLEDLAANHPDKYATFWKEFGRAFKEGVVEDHANKERIAKLLRFATTKSDGPDQTVSLTDYIARMKEGQDGDLLHHRRQLRRGAEQPASGGFPQARHRSPVDDRPGRRVGALEPARVRGKASDVSGERRPGSEGSGSGAGPARRRGAAGGYKDLLTRIQDVLGDRAGAVRLTERLTDSPACLVSEKHGMSLHLERLLKEAGQPVPGSKPVLEINPHHPVVERLTRESDPALFADWSQILFDQAVLAEGGELDDPAGFVKRLNKLTLALAGGPASKIWTPGN